MVRKLICSRNTIAAALAAVMPASLSGCELWNAGLDMLKFPVKAKPAPAPRYIPPTDVEVVPGGIGNPTEPPLIPASATVYRISAPVGTFTSNDKVWSELNEDALDSKTSVLLAQNGAARRRGADQPLAGDTKTRRRAGRFFRSIQLPDGWALQRECRHAAGDHG